MSMTTKRTGIAAALALLAVAAPTAAARPIERGYTAPRPHVQAVATHETGFDYGDAAVGAAVTGGLIALAGAGILVARRPREDAQEPLGAH